MCLTQVLIKFHCPKSETFVPIEYLGDCTKVWKISVKFPWRTSWSLCWGGCRPSFMGRLTILSNSRRNSTGTHNGPFLRPKSTKREFILNINEGLPYLVSTVKTSTNHEPHLHAKPRLWQEPVCVSPGAARAGDIATLLHGSLRDDCLTEAEWATGHQKTAAILSYNM